MQLIKARFLALLTSTVKDETATGPCNVTDVADLRQDQKFIDGTTEAGEANAAHCVSATVPSGGTYALDLKALVDAFGVALDFTTIEAIMLKNTSLVDDITIDVSVSNGWASGFNQAQDLKRGGSVALIAPDPGNAYPTGAADKVISLNGTGAGADVDVEIVIVGQKA